MLNEISQMKKDKYCMRALSMWDINKLNSQKQRVAKGSGDGRTREMLIKGYKLAIRRWVSPGDLMDRIVSIDNYNLPYT